MKNKRVFRVKKPDKTVLTFKEGETIPESMKAEFDRLEAELKDFETFVENDQEIKETFDRLENELKGMELKI